MGPSRWSVWWRLYAQAGVKQGFWGNWAVCGARAQVDSRVKDLVDGKAFAVTTSKVLSMSQWYGGGAVRGSGAGDIVSTPLAIAEIGRWRAMSPLFW